MIAAYIFRSRHIYIPKSRVADKRKYDVEEDNRRYDRRRYQLYSFCSLFPVNVVFGVKTVIITIHSAPPFSKIKF
jgi:hypothetical protein